MAGHGSDSLTHGDIFFQCLFTSQVQNRRSFLFPALSGYLDPVVLKSTSSISSPTHSETRTPVPRRSVTMARSVLLRLVQVSFPLSGEGVAAVFHVIQQHGYLVAVEADDGFFMDFRHINQHQWGWYESFHV